MTQIHILVIALKIAAIFLFLNVVQHTPDALLNAQMVGAEMQNPGMVLLVVIPAVVKLGVALVLWFFPKILITSIVPEASDSETSPASLSPLYKALVPAIGIYTISIAVPDLVYFLSLEHEIQKQFGGELQPSDKAAYVATIVQLIIGVLLIVGSKVIIKLLAKVRR